jgi:hypothetical protein
MGCLSRRAGIEPLLRHVTDQQLLWRNFLRGEIDAGGIAVGSSAVALIPLIESASVSLKVPRMVFLDELLEFWHSCFLQAGHQNVLDVGGFFAMPLNHKEVGTAGLEQWKYAGNRKYFSRSIYHAWATSEVRGWRLSIKRDFGRNPLLDRQGGPARTRESESLDRRLNAGNRSAEARGTEQFGQIGKAGCRFGNQARLSGSNWIMKKNGDCPEPVYFVGVPDRDLNPCYRRESRPRVRNRLKLNGTDSPLGHLSDCGDGSSDC